jgi:hypothetical protein
LEAATTTAAAGATHINRDNSCDNNIDSISKSRCGIIILIGSSLSPSLFLS